MPPGLLTIDRLRILARTVARRQAEVSGEPVSETLAQSVFHALQMTYYVACVASADAIQQTADSTEDQLLRLAMESLALNIRSHGESVRGNEPDDDFEGFFPATPE